MKVENMTGKNGNKVSNQFVIEDNHGNKYFQSYDSIIAKINNFNPYDSTVEKKKVELDKTYWNYSVTTGKYRNIFLGETKKETERKIKSGEYILTNLN